jgi:Effector Associated Constant Component 1
MRRDTVEIMINGMTGIGSDDLRELYQHVLEEWEVERAELLYSTVARGTLGGDVAGLLVQLGPEGAAAMASVLVAWLRYRVGRVKITARDGSGSEQQVIELDAQNVWNLDRHAVRAITQEVAKALREGSDKPEVPND